MKWQKGNKVMGENKVFLDMQGLYTFLQKVLKDVRHKSNKEDGMISRKKELQTSERSQKIYGVREKEFFRTVLFRMPGEKPV